MAWDADKGEQRPEGANGPVDHFELRTPRALASGRESSVRVSDEQVLWTCERERRDPSERPEAAFVSDEQVRGPAEAANAAS